MNRRITQGLFWSYGERILAQLVSFIVSIILARLLSPDEFGLVSLVMIFIGICNVFVTSGFGSGLIQKREADEVDFSTVLWASLFLGVTIYSILFLLAPFIELFFSYSRMTSVIRVLGLRIVLASVNSIQHAYVSRKMIFKKFFFSTLFGTIISAVVGICLAVKGLGVWAIVAQYLTNTTIDTIFLAMTIGWRPKFIFDIERVGFFVNYGWKVLAAALIDNLYTNIRSFIIGKRYTSSDLAYYNRGIQFPSLIVTNINSSIISVLFPALSIEQTDKRKMRHMVKKSVQSSSFILTPLLVGLMIIAEPLIILLLTEKWIECVPYIYIFSVSYLFMPIHAINSQAIKATGHSEVALKVEIAKKFFGIIAIFLSVYFYDSTISMAISFLAYSLVALVINAYPGKELYEYGFIEQFKDVMFFLLLGLGMGLIIYPIRYLIHIPLLLIVAQVLLGTVSYIGLAIILKNETCVFFISYIKGILQKKNLVK